MFVCLLASKYGGEEKGVKIGTKYNDSEITYGS